MVNKILIVEDQEVAREAYVDRLEVFCENEVEIYQASTREEALRQIEEIDDLKLVFTDLRIPNHGDGEAVAKKAQKRGIKVIIYSSSTNDLSEDTKGKCFAVLVKNTIEIDEIAQIVDNALAA